MVINVEYNQLDPLLRATGFPDGDVNCETGFSPFPGNINQVSFLVFYSISPDLSLILVSWRFVYVFQLMQLILELGSYKEELQKTEGAIKEFVNPK